MLFSTMSNKFPHKSEQILFSVPQLCSDLYIVLDDLGPEMNV